MGKNDACFCGSGYKTQNSHVDINENSFAAHLLKLYSRLDDIISKHYETTGHSYPCKAGCSQCCYDYFPISDIEFDLITIEMRSWGKEQIDKLIGKTGNLWNRMVYINPKYTRNLEEGVTGINNDTVAVNDIRFLFGGREFPCPFLNNDTQMCMVYNVRPLMCRKYGLTYQDINDDNVDLTKRAAMLKSINYNENRNICDIIGNSIEARKWQADITELDADIASLATLKSPKYDFGITKRMYPIIYWLYLAFIKYKTGLNIPDYEDKFLTSGEQYIQKIYNKMLAKGIR
jgi:Fe-S-cluster containining protein